MSWVVLLASYIVVGYIALIALEYVYKQLTKPGFEVGGKHVFITGGSTGLGLATAIRFAKSGAAVTIVARSVPTLVKAKTTIKDEAPEAAVEIYSCDVSDFAQLKETISKANKAHGRTTDYVVCSAGYSQPEYFLESTMSSHRKQMEINYFGTLHTIKAALPAMLEAKQGGQIVIVSSAIVYASIIGYSSYSPSKYALRGLAESLRSELGPHSIGVNVYYPSNIDTPGFKEEQKSKPKETLDVEGSVALSTAAQAADDLIAGISAGHFNIVNELMFEVVRGSSRGPTPSNYFFLELLTVVPAQLLFSGMRVFIDWQIFSLFGKHGSKVKISTD